MEKLITYSIFGNDPIYTNGLLANLEIAEKYYPGWKIRVYLEEKENDRFLGALNSFDVEIIQLTRMTRNEGLFWRFYPIYDPYVDIFICRDADSRLSRREASAVQEWVSSDQAIHVMRDSHNHSYPILAGMVGFKNSQINKRHFKRMIKFFGNDMNADQTFLAKKVWPKYALSSLVHDQWATKFPLATPLDVEGEISVNDAYGIGLIPFLSKRFEIHPEIFPTKNPPRPFLVENDDLNNLYVGQTIDQHGRPYYSQDARWEYELRGKKYPGI